LIQQRELNQGMNMSGIWKWALAGCLAGVGPQLLQAQVPTPYCVDEVVFRKGKSPWPAFSKLRFMEDYAWVGELGDGRKSSFRDSLDALKFIAVGSNGAYLSLGGSVRLRYEGYENYNFIPSADDSAYLLSRILIHGDLHLRENLRLFGEIRSAGAYGRDLPGGKSDSLADEIDVMNLFLDYHPFHDGERSLMLRLGRFEQTFGVGRMMGCREWAQLRNPLQGGKLRFLQGDFWVDAFVANPLISKKYEWAEPNENEMLWGLYSHFHTKHPALHHAEWYVLGKDRTLVSGRSLNRVSIGTRLEGDLGRDGWKYEWESAYQFGSGSVDVQAFFFAAEVKKSWAEHPLRPTIKGIFEYASGDANPLDETVRTFEAPAPYGHFYFGFVDVVGRQNILTPSLQVVLQPSAKWTLRMDLHAFWLAESADGLYSPCNCSQLIRKGFRGASRHVGNEVDLFFKYAIDHRMQLVGGYSHLFAGDFIAQTGADEDIDRVYLQWMLTF
jgi:hypothetical protein